MLARLPYSMYWAPVCLPNRTIAAGLTMPLCCWYSSCSLTDWTLLISTKRNLPERSNWVRMESVNASVSICSELLLRMESTKSTGRPLALASFTAGLSASDLAIFEARLCKSVEPYSTVTVSVSLASPYDTSVEQPERKEPVAINAKTIRPVCVLFII